VSENEVKQTQKNQYTSIFAAFNHHFGSLASELLRAC
jgi:hypothetical protein